MHSPTEQPHSRVCGEYMQHWVVWQLITNYLFTHLCILHKYLWYVIVAACIDLTLQCFVLTLNCFVFQIFVTPLNCLLDFACPVVFTFASVCSSIWKRLPMTSWWFTITVYIHSTLTLLEPYQYSYLFTLFCILLIGFKLLFSLVY